MYAVFTSTEGTPLANFIYLGDKQGELWVWIRAHFESKLTSGYARFESVPQPSVTPFGVTASASAAVAPARLLMARHLVAKRMKSKFAALGLT
jgi:hypothetical protein